MKVVPKCEAKDRMMIFYRMFMDMRKIYKAWNVTLEQRQRMRGLADDLDNYVLNNLKFLSYTSLFPNIILCMIQIRFRIVAYI